MDKTHTLGYSYCICTINGPGINDMAVQRVLFATFIKYCLYSANANKDMYSQCSE